MCVVKKNAFDLIDESQSTAVVLFPQNKSVYMVFFSLDFPPETLCAKTLTVINIPETGTHVSTQDHFKICS